MSLRGPPFQLSDKVLSLHAVLLVVALTLSVTFQGAFYRDGQRLVGGALAMAVTSAVAARGQISRDIRVGLTRLLLAFAVWSVASSAAAEGPSDAGNIIMQLAGLISVLVVCRRVDQDERDALVVGVLTMGVLCALSGWAGVAWRVSPLALEDDDLWRAASSLTYANATAAFLSPLAVLALARLAERPSDVLRSLTAYALLLGVAATLSRGGFVAFVAGVVMLAALLGAQRVVRAAIKPALAAAIGFAGLSPSISAAAPPRPMLALATLFCGFALCVAVTRRSFCISLAILPVTLSAAALAHSSHSVEDAILTIGHRRLSLASPDRGQEAASAIRLFLERPVAGVGPGNATLVWKDRDGEVLTARYAHNEYLQVLVELGAVGLGLLAGVLGAVAMTVGKGRAHSPSTEVWCGIAAALVTIGVHSGFDFIWHLPAIPLLAALLVGSASPTICERTLTGGLRLPPGNSAMQGS